MGVLASVVCAVVLPLCVAAQEEAPRSEAQAVMSGHLTYEPAPDLPGAGKHVVLVAGDEEYRSEEALPMLAKILARRHGFRCTVLFSLNEEGEIDPTASSRIPGLELLDSADALVLFTRFRRLIENAVGQDFEVGPNAGCCVPGNQSIDHTKRMIGNDYQRTHRRDRRS